MNQLRTGVMCVGWAVAAIAIAACGGGDAAPTPTATAPVAVSPAVTPTEPPVTGTPTLEEIAEAVTKAYLAYLEAYAEAVLHLDISLVEAFAAGNELESIREEIEMLRADGVALRVVAEHDITVIDVTGDTALIADEIVDNTFYVDARTLEPPEAEGSGDTYRDLVTLERIDGRWLVTSGARDRGD